MRTDAERSRYNRTSSTDRYDKAEEEGFVQSAYLSESEMNPYFDPYVRRLPIYLLLDTSASMAGSPLNAIKQGLTYLKREITRDTFARDTAKIGIIKFNATAHMMTRDTEGKAALLTVDNLDWDEDELFAENETDFQAIKDALMLSLENSDHVRRAVSLEQRSDWYPIVFILTDAEPVGDWRTPFGDLCSLIGTRIRRIILVGCGLETLVENLQHIRDEGLKHVKPRFQDPVVAIHMAKQEEYFVKYFDWVTQSVKLMSVNVLTGRTSPTPQGKYAGFTKELPPLPQGLDRVA